MKTLVPRAMLWMALATGCGPVEQAAAPSETAPGQVTQAIEDDNGLTPNGLAFNGLAFNGLAFNGLAFNGLAFNGLSSPLFSSWFWQHPSESNVFMKYLVRCAVPEGQTRGYKLGSTTYVWPGGLGLAPGWANGAAATLEEQQVVSACRRPSPTSMGARSSCRCRAPAPRGFASPRRARNWRATPCARPASSATSSPERACSSATTRACWAATERACARAR
ncbi:hypothetical protein ACN28S_36325 [Cystobacter fuscus]